MCYFDYLFFRFFYIYLFDSISIGFYRLFFFGIGAGCCCYYSTLRMFFLFLIAKGLRFSCLTRFGVNVEQQSSGNKAKKLNKSFLYEATIEQDIKICAVF